MKVLFVCRNNTGRSQVAMEFYNRLSINVSDSAGTEVEEPEKTVGERPGAVIIIDAMKEYGIDMSQNSRTQLTRTAVEMYDKIVIMAEPSTAPLWLSDNPNVIYWKVLDIKGQSIEVARQLRDEILRKVATLLQFPEDIPTKELVDELQTLKIKNHDR